MQKLKLVTSMFLIITIIALSNFTLADGNEITDGWNKTFEGLTSGSNDVMYGAAADSNGNIFMAGVGGNQSGLNTGSDAWVLSFNNSGTSNQSWNFSYSLNSGVSATDTFYDIAIDSENSVYVVGQGADDDSFTYFSWIIKKYDSNSSENLTGWNKTLYSGNASNTKAKSIAIDSSDNIYVLGINDPDTAFANIPRNITIIKFDKNGNKDWHFNESTTCALGSCYGTAESLEIDSEGHLLLLGTDYDEGNAITFLKLMKINGTDGTQIWEQNATLENTTTSSHTAGKLAIDSTDNVYITGSQTFDNGTKNITAWTIKKFSSTGTEDSNSNKTFRGKNSGEFVEDKGTVIAIDNTDEIYVSGLFNNEFDTGSPNSGIDIAIKNFNTSGIEESDWNKTFTSDYVTPNFATSDNIHDLLFIEGDGLYMVGVGQYQFGISSQDDIWLKKFNATGKSAAAIPIVPEWDEYALFFILAIALSGFYYVKKEEEN